MEELQQNMYTLIMKIIVMLNVIFGLADCQYSGVIREYCQEMFEPSCNSDEVLVMEQALYGRMQIGKCMKKDYGLTKCFMNQLNIFDHKCSGVRGCVIRIPNIDLTSKLDCLDELSPYLESSYFCQKVYSPTSERCIGIEKIPARKKSQYLASLTSKEKLCGIHESPWLINAEPGQQIELSIIDFRWTNDSRNSHICPINYGYILDMKTDDVIKICGGLERERLLYTSSGNSVQIVLEASNIQDNAFLMKFQAIGCPEYKPPKFAWVQHDNGTLTVGCEHSDNTWKVVCLDGIWLGLVGNCSAPPSTTIMVNSVFLDDHVEPVMSVHEESWLMDVSNNHVAVFSMACVTVAMCCTIVILGIFCTKKYEVKILKYQQTSLTRPNHSSVGKRASFISYRPVNIANSICSLPPYSCPAPKQNRGKDPMTTSDYLEPQPEQKEDDSVLYYVLENPAENMSQEMYQSIKLHHSLQSNNT